MAAAEHCGRAGVGVPEEPSSASCALTSLAAELALHLPTIAGVSLDEELPDILRRVGEASGSDWTFVVRLSLDGSLMSLVQQWLRDGASIAPTGLSRLASGEFPWMVERLRALQPVVIARVRLLPAQAAAERELFGLAGVESVTLVPLPSRVLLGGFLGIASLAEERACDVGAVPMLQVIAGALSGAIERASTERALRDSHGNLQALLDNLDDYLLILDHAGRILHANPLACYRLGYPIVDLKQMTLVDLYPPSARPGIRSLLGEQGRLTRGDGLAPLVTRDGVAIPVETRLVRGLWNGQQVLFAVCRDVSERERAQDSMRQSQARTSAVLAALPDTILTLRPDGTIVDPLRYGGESPRDDGFFAAVVAACCEPVRDALEHREVQVVEFEFERDGGARLYEVRLSALSDHEVLAIVRDISERARLEQMKADFINRASHELRTPVTTALLMVDLIQEGGEEQELKEYWDILRLELHRQHELVEDLLTVGRLDAGRMRMNMVPIDLVAVLRDAVEHSGPLAEARRISLRTEVGGQIPPIVGDTTALQRVFANLLDNAVKFTPAGGEVRLEAVAEPLGVRIRVSDNGIGIPMDEHRHLFERFFRASNAVRAEIQGTGVGLYIVKSIVEAHGGRARVESALDQGTTFEIWLPVASGDSDEL